MNSPIGGKKLNQEPRTKKLKQEATGGAFGEPFVSSVFSLLPALNKLEKNTETRKNGRIEAIR